MGIKFVLFTTLFAATISFTTSQNCSEDPQAAELRKFTGEIFFDVLARTVEGLGKKLICEIENRIVKRLKEELNIGESSNEISRCSQFLDFANKALETCAPAAPKVPTSTNSNSIETSTAGQQADPIQKCSQNAIRLVLVVDESGSVWSKDFKTALQACIGLVDKLTIGTGKHKSQVGLVTFDDQALLIFGLTQYASKDEIKNAISNVRQHGGTTNIGEGMRLAIKQLSGASPTGNKNVMVVLTDGEDDYGVRNLQPASDLAASNGITVYAIGIGRGPNMNQLNVIARDPKRVHKVDKYAELESELIQTVCDT